MMRNDAMIWPVLVYRDARKAATFLAEAFGFEERAMYTSDEDPSIVVHAELRWPRGGGVMVSTAGAGGAGFDQLPAGASCVYVVCNEPDALFERSIAVGAEVVRRPRDEDFGSRDFAVRDPEGVIWSFGTYAGE